MTPRPARWLSWLVALAACGGDAGGAASDTGAADTRDVATTTDATTADATPDGTATAGEVDALADADADAPGVRWRTVLAGLPEGLRDLWASGPSDLWVVGDGGLAAHGGPDGWRQLDLRAVDPTGGALRGVFGPDADHVWLVGDAGRVFRWTRARGAAERITIAGAPDLRAVWGASEDVMWVVGGRAFPEVGPPVVLRVSPDGATPQTLPADLPEGAKLLDVWGSGASDVWAVGEAGLVLHWNGVVWTRVDVASSQRLAAVTARDGAVVIVGGTFGGVLYERRGAGAFVETWPDASAFDGAAFAPDGALWTVGVLGHRAWRATPDAAWQDATDPDPVAWQDVWIDARGDVWVIAGGLEGRVARHGPERDDVPAGPLLRLDPRPDPEVEVVEVVDVEVVEAIDVEVIEPVDAGDDADSAGPDWPFVIGTLSPSNVFVPLVDGQAMPLIHGPQGGFHIEVAVRFPWASAEPEVVAALRLGLYVDEARQAVYETSGYPFAALGDGLFQSFIVPVMFDCIFSDAACTSSDFDGRLARLDIAVEPPGRVWSGALELVLEDTW